MKLFLILFIFCVVFIACVLFVKICKGCSIREATLICRQSVKDTLKEVLSALNETETEPEPIYPVGVGYTGNGFNPAFVDAAFSTVRANFASCYCTNITLSKDGTLVVYRFDIMRKPGGLDDDVLGQLVQKQTEEILANTMRLYDCYLPTEPLTLVELFPHMLCIAYARNDTGIQQLAKRKHAILKRKIMKNRPRNDSMKEKWGNCNKNKEMVWCYDRNAFTEYGLAVPIRLGIATHPHALITGSSGSGKSQALLFLIGKLLQCNSDTVVYLCDFKNSEDFSFLENYAHYYAGQDCYTGIMDYYHKFSQIREDKSAQGKRRYVLICDEYPAFVNYLQMQDKLNKTKLANDILGAVAEILMLGRGISFGCWIVTQRASADLFQGGGRDNFMITIGLGRMSKEQKGMIFAGQEIPDEIFGAGEGMLLADGQEIMSVKYPLIENAADWKKHILDILMETCRREEADRNT